MTEVSRQRNGGSYRIAVIPGDGTGPEVVANDIRSLAAGRMGRSTEEVGDLVAGYVLSDEGQ